MDVSATELIIDFDDAESEKRQEPMFKLTLGTTQDGIESSRDVMQGIPMILLTTLLSSAMSSLLHTHNAMATRANRKVDELTDRVKALEAVETMQREILGRVN